MLNRENSSCYSNYIIAKLRELCLASFGHVVPFGLNFPLNSEQNLESSASLRSVMWFILASITRQIQSKIAKALPRFAGPCGSFWTQSPVAFRAKIRELCFASLGHVVYFGFNLPSNSEQNFESYASLRSAMYIFVLVCCYIHAFFPVEFRAKF